MTNNIANYNENTGGSSNTATTAADNNNSVVIPLPPLPPPPPNSPQNSESIDSTKMMENDQRNHNNHHHHHHLVPMFDGQKSGAINNDNADNDNVDDDHDGGSFIDHSSPFESPTSNSYSNAKSPFKDRAPPPTAPPPPPPPPYSSVGQQQLPSCSSSTSSSSTSSSSSSPNPHHRHKHLVGYHDPSSSMQSSNNNNNNKNTSLLNILHMILVVIASATINGVVFGVVNNFGVFYAYLTELSKTNASLLGFYGMKMVMVDDDNSENVAAGHPLNIPQQHNQISSNNSFQIINNINSTNFTTTSDALIQSLIAGIGSLNVGLIFFCSIVASVLSDRYGIRSICFIGGVLATIGMYASSVSLDWIYLYVTYGIILGVGASLVYGPSLAILGHYFTKRLGLVNGLVTAGSSAFSIVMPILLRWLLDRVGIQVTFKYLSILMAVLILCSLSFKEQIKRPTKQNGSAKKNLANMFFYDALWKNNLYLYWVISIPMGLFGYFVPFCHLVKHAREINSYYQGEVLVMSIGITSMIGRLITGPLADFSHVNRICLQQIAFASIGLLTMFLPFVSDFPLLLVCCGLGLFDGTFISLLGPIAFDLVGPEYANQAIGLLLCFCSLPLTTGPPIAAYAYGIYGNYKLAFCLAGIPPIFAAILMFNIVRLQRMQRRRTSTVKLGIDDQRFDELMITPNGTTDNNVAKSLGINGEKLHLLINGCTNDAHHPMTNGINGINGTTKLNLSNANDQDNNGNEKTGLLLNRANGHANNIVIMAKDHHHHNHNHHHNNHNHLIHNSTNNNNNSGQSSRKSSIRT